MILGLGIDQIKFPSEPCRVARVQAAKPRRYETSAGPEHCSVWQSPANDPSTEAMKATGRGWGMGVDATAED